jgi:uncharacterized protein with HEPN domain
MRPRSSAFLWDIQRAASLVIERTQGLSADEIASDVMLKSAIERQLEIAGEAARRLADHDPETASLLSGLRSAIGIRSVIAHQYDRINWTTVREFFDGPLSDLERTASRLLEDVGPPEGQLE